MNKQNKCVLAIILSLALLISTVAISATWTFSASVDQIVYWDGISYSKPADTDGDGLLEIGSAAELAWFVKYNGRSGEEVSSAAATAVLTKDIWLNDMTVTVIDGQPIIKKHSDPSVTIDPTAAGNGLNEWFDGVADMSFVGTLDGNGHRVHGLYIKEDESRDGNFYGCGLIPRSGGCTVKNLGIENAYMNTKSNWITAFVVGSSHKASTSIDRCYVGETAYHTGICAAAIVGGDNGGATVTNCYTKATCNDTNNDGGVIIGHTWGTKGTVISCYTTGGYNLVRRDANNNYRGTVTKSYTPASAPGANAKTSMEALGSAYAITDGYPELKIFTNTDPRAWGGFVCEPALDTDGTTYLITNAEELVWALSGNHNGNTYKLTDDIYINDINAVNWVGEKAGTAKDGYTVRSWTTNSFYGTINGDGHIIYGLYNNKGATTGAWNWDDCRGLFNVTVNNAANPTTVTALGMDCLYVNTNHFAGAFVGKVNGANSKISFDKCFLGENATVSAYGIGGFVGVSSGNINIMSSCSLIATENMKMLTPYQRGGFLGNCWSTTNVSDSYAVSCIIGHKNTIPALTAGTVRYGGMATEGGSYTDPNKQPLTTVISTDKMKGIGALTKEGGMTGLSSAFVETSSYPILEVFKESLAGEHGVYFPLHRVIDYSEYTVIPGSGGNSWGPNDCKNGAAWFSTVTDETATGGKYLKFKAPHSSGAYPSAWLGHYGITMTPTGVYGGSGDENLTLENGTTYRVTMRMRTVELSGKAMSLFVAYGDLHHKISDRQNIMTDLGEMPEWTELTFTFTTPEAYTSGRVNCFIGLTLDADSTAFEYDIDTITLEKLTSVELYYEDGGEYVLHDTLFGIPGDDLVLPEQGTKEEYAYSDPTGKVYSFSFGDWYADRGRTEAAILKFANLNTAVYCKSSDKTVSATQNQEAFIGFDNYIDRVSGYGEKVTLSSDFANSGKYSLKAELGGTATAELRNDFTFELLSGKTYKAELFYKSTDEVTLTIGAAKGSYKGEFTAFNSITLPATEEFTKAELLFTADGAEDGSVLCVSLNAESATTYLDTVSVYSATESVGAEAETTENGEAIRFMMTYSGIDTDTLIMGGKEYTVTEHGVLVKGEDNATELSLDNRDKKGIFVFGETDMKSNWSVNPVTGATVYSVYLEGFEEKDDYKVSARGYIKLSDSSLFYTDIITASVSDIPEAGELIPESADLTDFYVYLPEGTVMNEATASTATAYNGVFVEDGSAISENTLQKGAYVAFSAKPDMNSISVPDELKYTLHSGSKADLYYGLDAKIVSEKLKDAKDAVNYIFITDIHYKAGTAYAESLINQVKLIADMANRDENIDFVVVGGDTTTGMFSTKEQAIAETQEILAPLKNCTKPVFVLMGNHDDNSYYYYTCGSLKAEFVISDKDWNDGIIDTFCPENIVQDDETKRPNSKYYYYDLNDTTRIICLDAIDFDAQYDENGDVTKLPGSNAGMNWWGYSADQMRWLAEDALDTDKNVIFVSHMGIDKETNCYNTNIRFGAELRSIISAYQKGESYTATLKDYWGNSVPVSADFSSRGRILSYQFGHMHIEASLYSEDIDLWQISTSSANVDQTGVQTEEALMSGTANLKTLPWRVFTRKLGTESEACFSVMSVSADRIYRYAVGVGNDELMIFPQ